MTCSENSCQPVDDIHTGGFFIQRGERSSWGTPVFFLETTAQFAQNQPRGSQVTGRRGAILTFRALTTSNAAIQRLLFASPPADGVFDGSEPGAGRGGEETASPRHTTTELESQLAEYRR